MSSFMQRTSFAFATFTALALAAFDPLSKTNVAVYYGQGPNQARLLQTCQNPSVDIVILGFVNAFPDNSPGGFAGTNFGNQCGDQTYMNNGVSTLLKSNCPNLGPDIIACQQTYGKKVLLSLGGGYPLNYYIESDVSANSFADFLWGAFGPSTAAWTNAAKPRPFGNAVVDGFDFDIESFMSAPPNDDNGQPINDYQSRGYATMVNRLKGNLFPRDTSKSYYISGAPQCPLPDTHLSSVISVAWFDFLFVQFYNNPACSARAAVNYKAGDSFLHWTQASSKNSAVKIYMGIPASKSAVSSTSDYITQSEALGLAQRFSKYNNWGGISLWESQYSQNNVACGQDYTTWMKKVVTAAVAGTALDTDTSKCAGSTTTTSAKAGPTTSPDGQCGGTAGYVCAGSTPCCSQYGYCGSDSSYCGANCNPLFGSCGVSSSSSITSKTTSSGGLKTSSASSSLSSTITSTTSVKPTTSSNPSPAVVTTTSSKSTTASTTLGTSKAATTTTSNSSNKPQATTTSSVKPITTSNSSSTSKTTSLVNAAITSSSSATASTTTSAKPSSTLPKRSATSSVAKTPSPKAAVPTTVNASEASTTLITLTTKVSASTTTDLCSSTSTSTVVTVTFKS